MLSLVSFWSLGFSLSSYKGSSEGISMSLSVCRLHSEEETGNMIKSNFIHTNGTNSDALDPHFNNKKMLKSIKFEIHNKNEVMQQLKETNTGSKSY
jgi:hypothetical protein